MTELRAGSVGHAARLLHCQLARSQRQLSAEVVDLAEAVMAAGVARAEEPDTLAVLKRYLPALFTALSRHTADANRWPGAHSLFA